jgi:hypothetical protein
LEVFEMKKKGLSILQSPSTTPEEIATIIANGHPPFEEGEVHCDLVTCEECWLAWLTTGKVPAPKRKPIR